jgi:RNA polymerase sigma-54 factor
MRLEQGLAVELQQKLMMTPELRQAIAILQLSSLELAAMVEQELLDNPVLEIEEPVAEEPVEAEVDNGLSEYADWAEYFGDKSDSGYIAGGERREIWTPLETAVDSLEEHLELQLQLAVMEEAARGVGRFIIGCIDEHGYLQGTVEEIAAQLGVSAAVVADVLKVIQSFDPPGIGARDLRECLSLQATQQMITDKLVLAVIDRFLDAVAAGQYKHIAEELHSTPHDVQQAVDIIRTLDPRPGAKFADGHQPSYIVPDISIECHNGDFLISLNDQFIPQLMINSQYRRLVREADDETRKFVEGRINKAVWLIKSIEQRRRTLYNVVEALTQLQQDFFLQGAKFLKPLTMKVVADQLGIHESTVSRAIANKYATIPQGVLSLRALFSAGLVGESGISAAATTVKADIKELLARENQADPLSDQAVVEILAKRGIKLSRRTVAKYREELGIGSSTKRRRY